MPRLAVIDDAGAMTGIGSFLRSLLSAFLQVSASSSWTVTLVAPSTDISGQASQWPAAMRGDRFDIQWITAPRNGDIGGWLKVWLDDHRPDVAYFVSPDRLCAIDSRTPLVATFHDFNYRRFETLPLAMRKQLAREIPRWLHRCSCAVVSSRFIASELTSYFPEASSRLHIVRLGIPDAGRSPEPEEWERFVAAASLPPRYLLTVGWLAPHKNQIPVLEAVARLRDSGMQLPLVCAGPNSHQLRGSTSILDPYVRAMTRRAAALDLTHGRDYWGLGEVSQVELRMLYQHATALVVPSLYEAGSFPLREAMREGCPVLCADVPPLAEEVGLVGGNASLFHPDDPDGIAGAARATLERPDEARAQAERARALVERVFNWRRTALGYLDAFEAALAVCAYDRSFFL